MIEFTCFHGTDKVSCSKIFKTKLFRFSLGDKHWLGDGAYFYEDDFYAYRWCIFRYKDEHTGKLTIQELLENYDIIKANAQVQKERVFDLDKPEPRSLYDITFEEIKNRKELIKRFEKVEAVEGVVLNYMFNELNFLNDYDLIRATFIRNQKNYRHISTRIGYTCEVQLCVRNPLIIKDVECYKYDTHINRYNSIWGNLFTDDDPKKIRYNPTNWAY
jgi:hypothetical protein